MYVGESRALCPDAINQFPIVINRQASFDILKVLGQGILLFHALYDQTYIPQLRTLLSIHGSLGVFVLRDLARAGDDDPP